MLAITWMCDNTFSTVNFIKSKYRSRISDKNLATKLRFQRLSREKKNVNALVNRSCTDYV